MTHVEMLSRYRQKFLTCCEKKEYRKAAFIGERLIHIQNAKETDMDLADDLYNLAWVYGELKSYKRSLALYTRSCLLVRKHLGKTLPFTYRINNMAVLYSKLGEYPKALDLYQESADIRKDMLGENHAEYADSLYNLANSLADAGDLDNALTYHLTALSKRTNGPQPDLIHSLNSISYVQEEKRNYKEAIAFCDKAIAALKKDGSQNGLEIIKNIYYLAQLYENNGETDKAIVALERVLLWVGQSLGKTHPYYANSKLRLATLYAEAGYEDFSFALRMEAVKLVKRTLGEKHIYYANALSSLAVHYKTKGQYDKAERFFKRAIKIKRELLGTLNREYLKDAAQLVGLYIEMRKYSEALDILTAAIDDLERSESQSADIVNELAKIYLEMNQIMEEDEDD